MSDTENPLDARRLSFAFIIAGILVLGAFSFTASGGVPTTRFGTSSCTVATLATSCTTPTITFSPPYSATPIIGQVNTTYLAATTPVNINLQGGGSSLNTQNNNLHLSNPGNSTILAHDIETLSTLTIPNTDTIIKSWNPTGIQPWTNVLVEGEGYVTTSALSIGQDITIKIEDCTLLTVFQTIIYHPDVLAIGKEGFAIKGLVPNNTLGQGFSCWSIDVQAPAADANTSITLVSFRVYGFEINFETWLNMPAAKTALYNGNNGQQYSFLGNPPTTPTYNLCANIITLSTSANARLYVNWTQGGSSQEFGYPTNPPLELNVGSTGTLGYQCLQVVQEFVPFGTVTVQVFTKGGAGIGDMPAFGAITLTWQQNLWTVSNNLPIGGHPQILLVTATSFQLGFVFDNNIVVARTITFNWQSIGT